MSDNKLDGDIRLFVPERYKEAQPCKEGRDGADQTRLGLESFSWNQKRFAVDTSSGSSFGHVAKSKKELSEAKIHFNKAQNKGSRTRKVEASGMNLINKFPNTFRFRVPNSSSHQKYVLSIASIFQPIIPHLINSPTFSRSSRRGPGIHSLCPPCQKSPRLQNLTGHLRPLGSSSRPQHKLPNILAFRAQVRTKIPFDLCLCPSAKSFPLSTNRPVSFNRHAQPRHPSFTRLLLLHGSVPPLAAYFYDELAFHIFYLFFQTPLTRDPPTEQKPLPPLPTLVNNAAQQGHHG